MRIYNDCYKVVKRKCFEFIKSQETSKEKFKNKNIVINNGIDTDEFSNNKTNLFNVEKVLKEVKTLSLGLN